MLLLQHGDGLGGELLVGDADLEGGSGEGGVFGEGDVEDDHLQHSDGRFCLDERGNFRLRSAAHVIRLFSAAQPTRLNHYPSNKITQRREVKIVGLSEYRLF